jgi:hypothetical protein
MLLCSPWRQQCDQCAARHRSTHHRCGPRISDIVVVSGFVVPHPRHIVAGVAGRWVMAVRAFGLHAPALHLGELTVVQPLLITTVLFALPASRTVGGSPVNRAQMGWASVLVLGLAAFFAAADRVGQTGTGVDL